MGMEIHHLDTFANVDFITFGLLFILSESLPPDC